MSTRRVIVFGMHEHEMAAAERAIPHGEVTESFVVGEADDAVIADLRSRGLIVQEVESAKLEALLPRAPRQATFSAGTARRRGKKAAKAKPTHLYRLSLKGPLLESGRRALERAGATIVESLPGYALQVRIAPARAKSLKKLKFLAAPPEPLASAAATVPRFDASVLAPSPGPTPIEPYDVLLTSEKARPKLVKWLQAPSRNVPVAGAQGKKVRIYALRDSAILDEIRGQTEWVDRLELFIAPKLFNDIARKLLGIDPNGASSPPPAFPFTGEGELVAIADTGIDETHPDFKGRIQKVVARGRPADATDPNGHGTHVAGSVLGDGSASKGEFKGTAPKAKLIFQSLLDRDDGLGGLPFELGELFEEAYSAGARIHNNSWGAATESTYRITSNEVDEFVRRRPDMLIVIAAGNEGSAFQPRNAKKGYVDWLSIGSPATCKNALTVGASRSSRAHGAYAPHTYGELWGDTFPDPPIAAAPVSGDAEAMGGFSSRGPCDEYRIKPDVVAPGTDVLSCRSVRAPLRNFWGGHTNPKYAFMGGTSMATPLVTGCAAAVRQYYVKERSWKPSAALLKATLINGTRKLSGQDSVADYPDLPNYHQGFGAIYLPDTVPNPRNPSLKLEFFDNWSAPASHFKVTGRRIRFKFDVAAGGPLRICMAYTDYPGRGVQNNLDLFLEVPGSPTKLFGNARVPRGFNGPDPNNNIEVIRIDNAPAGSYMVAVVASNILHPPQDVALVVTGRLTSSLNAI